MHTRLFFHCNNFSLFTIFTFWPNLITSSSWIMFGCDMVLSTSSSRGRNFCWKSFGAFLQLIIFSATFLLNFSEYAHFTLAYEPSPSVAPSVQPFRRRSSSSFTEHTLSVARSANAITMMKTSNLCLNLLSALQSTPQKYPFVVNMLI